MKLTRFLPFACLLFGALPAFCQSTKPLEKVADSLYNYRINTIPEEHIYLQLNKPRYNRADTIWFKAYTVAGMAHKLSTLSSVTYVELISPNDTLCERLNLKLENGIAWGDIALPINLLPGKYRLRAYTNWMNNQDQNSFYDQQVIIGNPNSPVSKTVKNNHTSSAVINSTNTGMPDVQFFPEGGELVNGLRNVMAFKAINNGGEPASLTGVIKTGDYTVAEIKSGHEGMGSFIFTPQAGNTYTAALTFADGSVQTVSLPKAVDKSFTLNINNREKDTITIRVVASDSLFKDKAGRPFYLIAWAGEHICYTTSCKLDEQAYAIRIPKNRFPYGIARITLFNDMGDAVNERVAFIQQDNANKLQISINKPYNNTTDKVRVELDAGVKDTTATGSYSVSVINEDKAPVDEASEPTIFSQLLLKTEIQSNIHNPAYYLANRDEKTRADLDLLMLTQGYRKLEWKKLPDTTKRQPAYAAEDGLSVSGTVSATNGKPVKNAKVGLFYQKQLLKIDTITDSKGRFNIPMPDIYGTAQLRLQASYQNKSDLVINVDKPAPPPHTLSMVTAGDTISTALAKSYQDEEKDYLKKKSRFLKEVKIRTPYDPDKNKPDMSSSTNLHGGGNADQVFMGVDLVQRGCIDLKTCLAISANSARIRNFLSSKYVTTYIDGAIGNIDDITANDVYSIEILASAKYASIYGQRVILITTRRGIPANEQLPPEKQAGVINYPFTGYYKTRVFYQPKYDALATDQPSAIYWKPDILTNKDGKAEITFNNEGKGNYRVVIEGIDTKGNLGRAVYRYKVE